MARGATSSGHPSRSRVGWMKAPAGALLTTTPDLSSLNSSLRRLHVGVLCALAFSAALVALDPTEGPPPGASPVYSLVALLIACVSIFARREPREPFADVRPILRRAVVGLAFAGLLGPLGIMIALREGAQTTGLLYALAGAFLSLRPPPEVILRNGLQSFEP